MDSSYTSRPHKLDSEETDNQHLSRLILHNDEINSFDYVMESLVEVCDHSVTQAEQCTIITHYKGKCDVRSGSLKELKEIRYRLISRGLKVTIE